MQGPGRVPEAGLFGGRVPGPSVLAARKQHVPYAHPSKMVCSGRYMTEDKDGPKGEESVTLGTRLLQELRRSHLEGRWSERQRGGYIHIGPPGALLPRQSGRRLVGMSPGKATEGRGQMGTLWRVWLL